MTTSRVCGRPSGQASRWSGLWTRCCTPWTTTGRSTPWTCSRPFTRRIDAAVPVQQQGQPQAERRPVERRLGGEAEGGRPVGMVVVVRRLGAGPARHLRRARRRRRAGRPAAAPPAPGASVGREVQRGAGLSACSRRPAARRGVGEVGLAHHQPVGQRHLLHRLREALEIGSAVHGIDHGDHVAQPEMPAQRRVGREPGHDRHRVGEAGGLDHHPLERRHLAALHPPVQPLQPVAQVAADRAADAAALEQHHLLVDLLDQQMVEPDLAELVDQHGRAAQVGQRQEPLEQRGLAAAEKAGQQMGGDRAPLADHPAERARSARSPSGRADRSAARPASRPPATRRPDGRPPCCGRSAAETVSRPCHSAQRTPKASSTRLATSTRCRRSAARSSPAVPRLVGPVVGRRRTSRTARTCADVTLVAHKDSKPLALATEEGNMA